jgi:small subunit ribosomal protein S6
LADLRKYEVLFIVDPGADDDEVAKITEMYKQIITEQGGVITKAETLGRRQLAYEILKKREGIYVDIELDGSGKEIAELERRMRVNDRILRYLTVRTDEQIQRAEKFKDKRARKAAKRPFGAGQSASSGRRGPSDFNASDDSAEG